MAGAILGISPGTRHMGIAVEQNGRLVQYRVHTFSGKWSNTKLRLIFNAINKHTELHAVERIVVKIPDVFPTTKAFNQLIGCVNIMASRKKIAIHYLTLNDLKLDLAGTKKISRACLIDLIIKSHPELMPEYQREKQNQEGYYYKMFEAVMCTKVSVA